MPTAKALLALFVSVSLTLPAAAAPIREVEAIVTSGEHLTMPVAPAALETALQPVSLALPAQDLPPADASAKVDEPAPESASDAKPSSTVPTVSVSTLAALKAAPVGPIRARWDRFWSNASARVVTPDIVLTGAVGMTAAIVPHLYYPAKTAAVAEKAAALAAKTGEVAKTVPSPESVSDLHSVIFAHAAPHIHSLADLGPALAPYAEAGGVILITLALSRLLTRALNNISAKNNLARRKAAPVRFIAKTVLLVAGGMVTMTYWGASMVVQTTAWGLLGFTLGNLLKDALDNRAHGIQSMIIRPFKIGMRVSVDGKNAKIIDATKDDILMVRDDDEMVRYLHTELADKTVIVYGEYAPAPERTRSVLLTLKWRDGWNALWASLDRRFKAASALVLTTGAFAEFVQLGETADKGSHLLFAATVVWLAWRIKAVVQAAITLYAKRTGMPKETKMLAEYSASIAFWVFSSPAFLYLLQGPFAWLSSLWGDQIGLKTVAGLSAIMLAPLAYTTFVTTLSNGLEISLRNAMSVIRHWQKGTTNETINSVTWAEAPPLEGEILDVTGRDTVIKLAEDPANPGPRYARIPHTHKPLVVIRPPTSERKGK